MKRLLIVALFVVACASKPTPKPSPTPQCSADGGYEWCPSIQQCVRPWETKCPPCEHVALPNGCTWVFDKSGDCTKDKLACAQKESLWHRFKCWFWGSATCSVRGVFI